MSLLWDASRVITLYGYWSLLKLSGHLTSSGLCGKPKYSCNESLSISSGNLIFFFSFSARCHRKKTSRNSTVQLSCSVAVCWTLAKPLMANWLFSWLLRLGTHREKKKKSNHLCVFDVILIPTLILYRVKLDLKKNKREFRYFFLFN